MPYTTCYMNPQGEIAFDLGESAVRAAHESGDGLLWVDVSDTAREDGEFLERVFGFHPLAIDDCTSPAIHSPKIDDFDSYLFMIFHGINYAVESEAVETTELATFLGANYVVTNHNVPMHSVETIRASIERDGRLMRRGAVFLAHALVDALIDNVTPTIDRMREVTDEIESEVIKNPLPPTLETVLRLKRSSLRLHRVMAPQRDILNRLSRGDYELVAGDARMYYRDVYDHVVRIEELNQSVREMTDSALATYLSSVANRQNELMKVLAVIATVFMPLSFLAGLYGMNFDHIPELHWKWSYFVLLGVMATIAGGILWSFWGGGMLNWGRRRVPRARRLVAERARLATYVGSLHRRARR